MKVTLGVCWFPNWDLKIALWLREQCPGGLSESEWPCVGTLSTTDTKPSFTTVSPQLHWRTSPVTKVRLRWEAHFRNTDVTITLFVQSVIERLSCFIDAGDIQDLHNAKNNGGKMTLPSEHIFCACFIHISYRCREKSIQSLYKRLCLDHSQTNTHSSL